MDIDELLKTLPDGVRIAIEQIANKAGTYDAAWEFIKAAGELLHEAQSK